VPQYLIDGFVQNKSIEEPLIGSSLLDDDDFDRTPGFTKDQEGLNAHNDGGSIDFDGCTKGQTP
jgi:hypothetical protein